MPSGNKTPEFAIMLAAYIVGCILYDNAKKDIAVLTCMRKTTKAIQKAITQTVGAHKNVLIDTVARVQGLTTDIAIFCTRLLIYKDIRATSFQCGNKSC